MSKQNQYEDDVADYSKGTTADFMRMLKTWRTIYEMAALTGLNSRTVINYLRIFETWTCIKLEQRAARIPRGTYPRHMKEYRVIIVPKPEAFRV